jgi:3-dehydroquinate synthase
MAGKEVKTLRVGLHPSYPVYLGENLLADLSLLSGHIKSKQVFLVTQKSIAQFYLDALLAQLSAYQVDVCYLAEGEVNKNISEWQKIFAELIEKRHERSTTLIALGGGMVGDMTGFAAACYQRGVSYIQIPTSLIAQVDSSVGGKTGINFSGKNMLGAFYQPSCVVIDLVTLKTLPEREFVSGLAEIVKYGLIYDVDFFAWLEKNYQRLLLRDVSALQYAIECSVQIKSDIVAQDEHDLGLRNILNFGHTLGHALETLFGYTELLHGEAVAVGMLLAANVSCQRKLISEDDLQRIRDLLNNCQLLKNAPAIADHASLFEIMKRDKKAKNGRLNFILLERIGKAIKLEDVEFSEICLVR